MTRVVQEDDYGCAVACVAFVLRIQYKDAISLFENGSERARKIPDFYCREISEILGSGYSFKYIKPRFRKEIYKDKVIIFIKKSKKYKCGHYLVRYKNKWMDPWINFPAVNRSAGFRKRLPGRPIYMISK